MTEMEKCKLDAKLIELENWNKKMYMLKKIILVNHVS